MRHIFEIFALEISGSLWARIAARVLMGLGRPAPPFQLSRKRLKNAGPVCACGLEGKRRQQVREVRRLAAPSIENAIALAALSALHNPKKNTKSFFARLRFKSISCAAEAYAEIHTSRCCLHLLLETRQCLRHLQRSAARGKTPIYYSLRVCVLKCLAASLRHMRRFTLPAVAAPSIGNTTVLATLSTLRNLKGKANLFFVCSPLKRFDCTAKAYVEIRTSRSCLHLLLEAQQ